jgi:radical SAM superfamily enzyme YgiQ (UPF0313 family)
MVCNNYGRLSQFLQDERVNAYISYYRDCGIVESVVSSFAGELKVVGISLEGENQVVSTLTLAQMLKQRDPEVVIVLGGPWITQMRKVLRKEVKLLKDIDFLVPNKGEIPFVNLLEMLAEHQGRPRQIELEGVMSRGDNGYGDYTPVNVRLKAEDLPRPKVFALSAYMRPNVLPYESIRGCYWGKCKFCHHIPHYTRGYDAKSIDKIIWELHAYKRELNFDVMAFVDAAIPPKRLEAMARAFIKKKLDIRWACFCRIEKQFTPEIFKIAAQSDRVLKDCSKAGIYTTAGILNGMPSETEEDLQELMDFLDDIKSFTYLYPHLLKLERESEFYEKPGKFNIEIVPNPPDSRLSVYSDFIDHNSGITTRQCLKENNINKKWWWEHMGQYLDWKSKGARFCQPKVVSSPQAAAEVGIG